MNSRESGFTLIEFILYIALVSIVTSSIILSGWNLVYGRQKAYVNQVVQQNARLALSRIEYEIRRAESISSISPTQLVLVSSSGTTTIEQSGSNLQIHPDGFGPYSLISNEAKLSSLTFTDLSTDDSKNIGIELTLVQSQNTTASQFQAETTLVSSSKLNALFDESQNLLVDAQDASLIFFNWFLDGIAIENTGDGDITIDQIKVVWSGTSGSEDMTRIRIGNSNVWNGSVSSGSTVDISDVVLQQSNGEIDIDYFRFNSNMSGAEFNIEFIMSDGSTRLANIITNPSATPTPSGAPSPTPTPANCSDYCQQQSYSSGVCRRNAFWCLFAGETHESGGDYLCTGGSSSDTCCCDP